MNKTALVLEGGTMRGMFTAGKNHIFIFQKYSHILILKFL